MNIKLAVSSLGLNLLISTLVFSQNYAAVSGDLDFQGSTLFSGNFDVTGDAEFSNNVALFGETDFYSHVRLTLDGTLGSSFVVQQPSTSIAGEFENFFTIASFGNSGFALLKGSPILTLDSAENSFDFMRSNDLGASSYRFSATTSSTSSSTGAIVVDGGVGILKDSHINGLTVGRGGGNADRNTVIGSGALASNLSSGFANTAIGKGALSKNTTADHNTALGMDTLRDNTTGIQNTSVGSQALRGNTTGHYNVAVGVNSLILNTSGQKNTAIGRSALNSNTTGYSNDSIGFYSLYRNTTGYYNSAAGYYAMERNLSGFSNTAQGHQALRYNKFGDYNVAMGDRALWRNLVDYNVGIGNNALYSNQDGERNTAVGTNALYGLNNAASDENVALGSDAGRYQANGSTALSVAKKSIYIGAKSRGKSNADDNSIVIGYNAVGQGANTTVIGNDQTTATYIHGEIILVEPSGDIAMGVFGSN